MDAGLIEKWQRNERRVGFLEKLLPRLGCCCNACAAPDVAAAAAARLRPARSVLQLGRNDSGALHAAAATAAVQWQVERHPIGANGGVIPEPVVAAVERLQKLGGPQLAAAAYARSDEPDALRVISIWRYLVKCAVRFNECREECYQPDLIILPDMFERLALTPQNDVRWQLHAWSDKYERLEIKDPQRLPKSLRRSI